MKNKTKHTLLIEFANTDDCAQFEWFARKAKEQTGTVAPLWCGLASSAMHRATLKHDAAPDLLAALKAVVARLTQPVQFSQNTTEATCGILREDAASVVAMVKRELARAEGRGE